MKKLLLALSAFVLLTAVQARAEDKPAAPADDKSAAKAEGKTADDMGDMKHGKKMKHKGMKKGMKMKDDGMGMKDADHKDMDHKDMDHKDGEAPPAK